MLLLNSLRGMIRRTTTPRRAPQRSPGRLPRNRPGPYRPQLLALEDRLPPGDARLGPAPGTSWLGMSLLFRAEDPRSSGVARREEHSTDPRAVQPSKSSAPDADGLSAALAAPQQVRDKRSEPQGGDAPALRAPAPAGLYPGAPSGPEDLWAAAWFA
jgi:hypothetical protein